MASIKIRGGTAPGNTRLCDSCGNATKVLGSKPSEEYVRCDATRLRVTWQVTFCTAYSDANAPSLWNMQQIAWPIASDKKGNLIGFKSPADFNKLVEDGKVASPSHLPDIYDE